MTTQSFADRAAFAFDRARSGHDSSPSDLASVRPEAQARAWDVYADGYAAHARSLEGHLAELRQELAQTEAEVADARAQARAAREVAACLRAPWPRRRATDRLALLAG